jgi:hypothetical protein
MCWGNAPLGHWTSRSINVLKCWHLTRTGECWKKSSSHALRLSFSKGSAEDKPERRKKSSSDALSLSFVKGRAEETEYEFCTTS